MSTYTFDFFPSHWVPFPAGECEKGVAECSHGIKLKALNFHCFPCSTFKIALIVWANPTWINSFNSFVWKSNCMQVGSWMQLHPYTQKELSLSVQSSAASNFIYPQHFPVSEALTQPLPLTPFQDTELIKNIRQGPMIKSTGLFYQCVLTPLK